MSPAPQVRHKFVVAPEDKAWAARLNGFTQCGFIKVHELLVTDFILYRDDGSGLRFSNRMVNLAERLEVGVLHIQRASSNHKPKELIKLPTDYFQGLSPQKLVLNTEFASLESGLVLTTNKGTEIVIVAGASPYTVAVKADFISTKFEPEYSINTYERHTLSNA
jgi:hypothetical protein